MSRLHLPLVFIWVTFVACAASGRSDIDDLQTERLLKVRSSTELLNTVVTSERLSDARAACSAQMKSSSVIPIQCFRVVELEVAAGLVNEGKALSARLLLTETCRERARTGGRIEALQAAFRSREMTKDCRVAVSKRIEEIQYMAAAGQPAIVFDERLNIDVRPAF